MNRVKIKEQAKKKIAGNLWVLWKPILVIFACSMVLGLATFIPGINIIASFAIIPLSVGLLKYYLAFIREEEFSINTLFSSYKDIIPILLVSILITVFTCLWSILFIIPGIIAALSYSQAFFLIANGKVSKQNPMDAIQKSKELMLVHKMDLFIFHLSFLGWSILCALTLELAMIWVIPYYQTSLTLFYDALLKENQEEKEKEQKER